MKVFLIPPPALPVPATRGGAVETLLTHLIEENEQQQCMELVCISVPDREAEIRAQSYHHAHIYYLPHKKRPVWWGPICGTLRRLGVPAPVDPWFNHVLSLIKCERPDLVIAEGGNLLELAMITRQVGRKRMVAHLHMQTECTPQLEALYGSVFAISHFVADAWRPVSPMPVHLVRNCVDTSLFHSGSEVQKAEAQTMRRQLKFDSDDFVIVFCGRICPEKGIHALVQAISCISDEHIKLLVIGSPFFEAQSSSPFSEQLKRDAAQLQMRGRIVFTGFIHNSQLPTYYRLADVACFPALWDEPAGITAIEAMACGCPIIATRSGGMPEYLEGSGAILIERDKKFSSEDNFSLAGSNLPLLLADKLLALKKAFSQNPAASKSYICNVQAFSTAAYYRSFYHSCLSGGSNGYSSSC